MYLLAFIIAKVLERKSISIKNMAYCNRIVILDAIPNRVRGCIFWLYEYRVRGCNLVLMERYTLITALIVLDSERCGYYSVAVMKVFDYYFSLIIKAWSKITSEKVKNVYTFNQHNVIIYGAIDLFDIMWYNSHEGSDLRTYFLLVKPMRSLKTKEYQW